MSKHVIVALSTVVAMVFGGMALSYAARRCRLCGAERNTGCYGRTDESTCRTFGGICGFISSAALAEGDHGETRHKATDEQKRGTRSLYVGFSDRTRKARTELMALKDEKKTMLLFGKIDQQKLAQIDDQFVQVKADLLKEKLKFKRERLASLTPQQ